MFQLVFKEWPGIPVASSDRTANQRESFVGTTGVARGKPCRVAHLDTNYRSDGPNVFADFSGAAGFPP